MQKYTFLGELASDNYTFLGELLSECYIFLWELAMANNIIRYKKEQHHHLTITSASLVLFSLAP